MTIEDKLHVSTHWYPEQTPEYVERSRRARVARHGEPWKDPKWWDLNSKQLKEEGEAFKQHVLSQIVEVNWGWNAEDQQVSCFIEVQNGQSIVSSVPCLTLEGFHAGVGRDESYKKSLQRLSSIEIYVQATDKMRHVLSDPK